MLVEGAGTDEVHRAVQTLVVAGGYNGNRLGTVELLRSFSSHSATWQRAAASLPFRISSASLSLVGKDLFLSGGSGACSGGNYCAGRFHTILVVYTCTGIYKFDSAGEEWKQVKLMDSARSGHATTAISSSAPFCTN